MHRATERHDKFSVEISPGIPDGCFVLRNGTLTSDLSSEYFKQIPKFHGLVLNNWASGPKHASFITLTCNR